MTAAGLLKPMENKSLVHAITKPLSNTAVNKSFTLVPHGKCVRYRGVQQQPTACKPYNIGIFYAP